MSATASSDVEIAPKQLYVLARVISSVCLLQQLNGTLGMDVSKATLKFQTALLIATSFLPDTYSILARLLSSGDRFGACNCKKVAARAAIAP